MASRIHCPASFACAPAACPDRNPSLFPTGCGGLPGQAGAGRISSEHPSEHRLRLQAEIDENYEELQAMLQRQRESRWLSGIE